MQPCNNKHSTIHCVAGLARFKQLSWVKSLKNYYLPGLLLLPVNQLSTHPNSMTCDELRFSQLTAAYWKTGGGVVCTGYVDTRLGNPIFL